MSDTESNTTATAVDGAAVTGDVERSHATVPPNVDNVIIAGEQTCARCAGYTQKLTSTTERNDTHNRPMKLMESEALISMTLTHTREQDMFVASPKKELANRALQKDKDLLVIKVQHAELDTRPACSKLTLLEEKKHSV